LHLLNSSTFKDFQGPGSTLDKSAIISDGSHSRNPSIFDVAAIADQPVAELVGLVVEISADNDEITPVTSVLDELTDLECLDRSMGLMFIQLTVLCMQLNTASVLIITMAKVK